MIERFWRKSGSMNVVAEKSYSFAIEIVWMYKYLSETKREFVLSKQLLRCGTAIGALVRESQHAQSRADFLNKINIALKEANEVEYWLFLLKDTKYISEKEFTRINSRSAEILRLLISIVRTTKASLNKK